MDIGLYQSASSLSALERWQDAVSQNITSSQVSGYRKRTVEFSAVAAGQWQPDANSDSNDSGVPALFPKATNGINFKAGDTEPSGRELDVAVQGQGFFEIQGPDGSKTYTRTGEFSVRQDRTLVNSGGGEVLSDSGFPITLSPGGGKVVINPDGTVIHGSSAVGKIALVDFDDPSQLTPIAGGIFANRTGQTPNPVEKPNLLQGYVEASNVTPMREMVDLVLISRSYEANQNVIKAADQEAQKELDALG